MVMDVPIYIPAIFILTTGLTFYIFLKASQSSKIVFWTMAIWLIVQGLLSFSNFYLNSDVEPFRLLLAAPIALVMIFGIFISKKGRRWMGGLDFKTLTLLHTVRIPVEIVLYLLFLNQAVPELMTFSGRNFDILAGLTAPLVYYFGFVKANLRRKTILFWNIICMALLLNIVVNAILSAPLPFQKFAFDQPNIAILYFPFIWLPTFIVPIVSFSHLEAIKRLARPAGEFQ